MRLKKLSVVFLRSALNEKYKRIFQGVRSRNNFGPWTDRVACSNSGQPCPGFKQRGHSGEMLDFDDHDIERIETIRGRAILHRGQSSGTSSVKKRRYFESVSTNFFVVVRYSTFVLSHRCGENAFGGQQLHRSPTVRW